MPSHCLFASTQVPSQQAKPVHFAAEIGRELLFQGFTLYADVQWYFVASNLS